MTKKVSFTVDSGLWGRVDKMATRLSITVSELIEHCLVRRIRKLEFKHATRIMLENTKPNAKKAAPKKKKVAVKRKKATPKKKVVTAPITAVA